MMFMIFLFRAVLPLVVVLQGASASFAGTVEPPSIAVSRLGDVSLRGSKFRHVGAFNDALKLALRTCGQAAASDKVSVTGQLSVVTASAVKVLRHCPGFEGATNSAGDITPALWTKLLPTLPMPDAFARLFIVTLTLEGTDYDHFEWNYSAVDPTAWGTWGPFGATIGQDAEIQKILKAVEEKNKNIVKDTFKAARDAIDLSPLPTVPNPPSRQKVCAKPTNGPAQDYDLFTKIVPLRDAAAGEALRTAFCSDRRYAIWVEAFRRLGRIGLVRRTYDDLYFGNETKVAGYIRKTQLAYSEANAVATEVDLAMGVDGPTQLSPRGNIEKVRAAIASVAPTAEPFRRRAAISEAIPAPARSLKDRCGRDAVFFIDELNKLPAAQTCKGPDWDRKDAWAFRAGFSAALVGLRDEPAPNLKPVWDYDFDK